MRITFIGTGPGIPEGGRRCSSALLESGSRKYIIDMGTDALSEMMKRGITPDDLTAVFITHQHDDHIDGMFGFLNALNWGFPAADPEIFLPRPEAADFFRSWSRFNGMALRESIRFSPVKKGCFYEDDTIRVTALENGHCPFSYGFLIEAEGKALLFSGDLKVGDGATADFGRFLSEYSPAGGIDLAVSECAHFDAMTYIRPLRENPPKRFFLNHYTAEYIESCYRLKAALLGELPVILLNDNYEISL